MRTLWLSALALGVCVAPLPAGPIYLALGDSSAFGETNRTQNPSNGDRGYVRPFADYLGTVFGTRPTVMNYAINGETTGSYFSGTGRVSSDGQGFNTNYNGILTDPYPQYQRMLDTFGNPAAAADVRVVTVQFGANNLDAVASTPGFLGLPPAEQQALVAAALAQVQADYIQILGDLRARFANADIYTLGYHNPYNGDPTHPFYPLADPAVLGLNQVIAGVSSIPQFNARYVDVYGAINPNEASLTFMTTWQTDPVNYVHLNDAGYRAVGDELIRTAGGPAAVPEPASLVLVGVGGLVALAVRLRRGKVTAG
jgi:lysophospholipase L1-like esterase